MKYSDIQRVEKINITAGKLLAYLDDAGITAQMVLEQIGRAHV